MNYEPMNMIAGHDNDESQQFEQLVGAGSTTKKSNGFIPVNGDAVISELKWLDGNDALATLGAGGHAYQNVYYPGKFKVPITTTSGNIISYCSQQ